MADKEVAVVGAGLVGSLMAVLLAKKEFQVDVFERRPDLRKATAIGGRSINLALSDRGFKALEMADFADEIRDRKSTRLNSSHSVKSRMPSSA